MKGQQSTPCLNIIAVAEKQKTRSLDHDKCQPSVNLGEKKLQNCT